MGRDCKWHLLVKLELQDGGDRMKPFLMDEIKWTPFQFDKDEITKFCIAIPLYRLDTFIIGESRWDGMKCDFIHVTHRDNNYVNYKEGNVKLYSRKLEIQSVVCVNYETIP